MTPHQIARTSERLEKFIGHMFADVGGSERCSALGLYVHGLLLDGERKSIEPMASRLIDNALELQSMRQRLQRAVNVVDWDPRVVFRRIAVRADRRLAVEAYAIDDTGFPKKGYSSVGVARQYSGTLGRVDNCQVASSLHLASEGGGACIGMRLYLPRQWAEDRRRRAKVHVPESVQFAEKWRSVLAMLDDALEWGLPKYPVVGDAAYGDCTEFREALIERGLTFVLGIASKTVVWPPGVEPSPPIPRRAGEGGRPRTRWTSDNGKPVTIADLARSLPSNEWQHVTWREGTRGPQTGRFAAIRVRTAHRHTAGCPPGEEMWLLCEWPRGSAEPTTFYLSNLPRKTTIKRLVHLAKIRWRIERDYQEMKGELGLDHYEGRTWRGFHHHAACVAAAHAFLTLERVLFPPADQDAHGAGVPADAPGCVDPDGRSLPDVPSLHRAGAASHPATQVMA